MEFFLEWVAKHWILSIIFCFPAFLLIDALQQNILRILMLAYSRTIRSINITIRGWPPEHLDADGDSLEEIRLKYKLKEQKCKTSDPTPQ